MKVLKFGGTSLGSADRIKNVVELILSDDSKGKIVVFSAMSGITNSLSNICEYANSQKFEKAKTELNNIFEKYQSQLNVLYSNKVFLDKALSFVKNTIIKIESNFNEPFSSKNAKEIMAQGEIVSSNIIFYYLQELGKKNIKLLDALDIIELNFDGEVDMKKIKENLDKNVNKDSTYITQGYICRDFYGNIDNLKRGGSDYTASLIGSALNVDVIEIWTDIDGFHNSDPRCVRDTKSIDELSFDEAAELSYFGAKILHPSTIIPAKKANIPVVLKNTLSPDKKGSIIKNINIKSIKSVAAKDGITVIRIESSRMLLAYGFLSKIFDTFNKYKKSIDMIVTSEVSVSVSIDDETNLDDIIKDLENIGNIEVDKDKTIISIVGDSIISDARAVDIFKIISSDIDIRMISYGGSKNNVSLLINTYDKVRCLNLIHSYLF